MKYSKQREMILDALRKAKGHPSAEHIYAALKNQNPALSLGTVYRNLNLFCRDGTAGKLRVDVGPDRFDANCAPHCHLFCTSCDRLMDLHDVNPEEVCALVEEKTSYRLQSRSVVFYGICDDCAKKNDEV